MQWQSTPTSLAGPLLSLARSLFPQHIATTEQLSRVMINVARHGHGKPIVHNADIAGLAKMA